MLAIFLDLETTGLDSRKHSVLEIAFKVVDVSAGELKASYESIIKQPFSVWENRDPTSIEVNGFTFEKCKQGKDESIVADEIIKILNEAGVQRGKAVFICQNPAFDRGFFAQLISVYTQEKLNWPYHWLDFASMYWALLVERLNAQGLPFPDSINLSKNEIAKKYNLPPEDHPHKAINGVDHLLLCYQTVVGQKLKIGVNYGI